MRENLKLKTEFKHHSGPKPGAIRAYHSVLDLCQIHRRNMKAEHLDAALTLLAPFMPGLSDNREITAKDKVCIYTCYAKLLTDIGDLEAALQCTRASIAFDPYDVKTLSQSATILRKLDRPLEALDILEKAREISPHDKFTLTLMAGCHEDLGEFLEARKLYQETISRHPRDRRAADRLKELSNI